MKRRITLLGGLTVFFVFLNFILLYEFPPEVHRWGRLACSSSLFLLFIIRINKQNALLALALACLVVGDIFALQYDLVFSQHAFLVLQTAAYLVTLINIRKLLKKTKTVGYERWFFTGVFLINIAFVFIMGGIFSEEVNNPTLIFLFYLYATFAVFLLSSGVIYHNNESGKKSTAFLLAVIGLVFSNITGFSAHFLEYTELFYANRLLYVTGVASLVYFGYAKKDSLVKEDFLKESISSKNQIYHQGDVDVLENSGL